MPFSPKMDKILESSIFLQPSVAFGFEPAMEVTLLHQIILTLIHQTRSVSTFWKVLTNFCLLTDEFLLYCKTEYIVKMPSLSQFEQN